MTDTSDVTIRIPPAPPTNPNDPSLSREQAHALYLQMEELSGRIGAAADRAEEHGLSVGKRAQAQRTFERTFWERDRIVKALIAGGHPDIAEQHGIAYKTRYDRLNRTGAFAPDTDHPYPRLSPFMHSQIRMNVARSALHLTQAGLGEALGVTRDAVASWERSRNPNPVPGPVWLALRELARQRGLDPDEVVLTGSDQPPE